jgi:hypothetical protein
MASREERYATILEGANTRPSARRGLRHVIPKLPNSGPAAGWLEFVNLMHANGFRGAKQRLAIIDTGCEPFDDALRSRITDTFNLTTEPDDDYNGHGTTVALLANRVAPEAEIVVIKAFAGRGAASESTLASALETAADAGATIINVSAGLAREKVSGEKQGKDWAFLDDAGVCNCSICSRAERIAGFTGAAIFAAAGNREYPPTLYTWRCPALAAEVIPVVGLDGPDAIARPTFAVPTAMEAPGVVSAVTYQHSPWWAPLLGLFGYGRSRGSSFAVPLVAGTAALLGGMFPVKPKELFFRNIRGAGLTTGAILEARHFFEGFRLGPHEPIRNYEMVLFLQIETQITKAFESSDFDRCIALCGVLIGLYSSRFGDGNESLIIPLINIAKAEMSRGDLYPASEALLRARSIRDALPPGAVDIQTATELERMIRVLDREKNRVLWSEPMM